jgi:manganese efflux pump family protein
MSSLAIIGIAFALAMDAFTVALAVGATIRPLTGRHFFRLGWHFGLFQFLMPVLGWLAGTGAQQYISAYDHWVAATLLFLVGGHMIYSAIKHDDENLKGDPTRGLTLVVLSVATSIDALAIGVTLAALKVTIWHASVVIGVVASAMTVIGMLIGVRLGRLFAAVMPGIGGIILCGIGVKILIDHCR